LKDYKSVIKPFSELSLDELYSILQLRSLVFVVEQHCPYLDADGKDYLADHVLIYSGNRIVAYSRIFFPGAIQEEAVIGRVVSHPEERGKGIGKLLMHTSIQHIENKYPEAKIYLGAQEYLRNFYESLGFIQTGPGYLEDDIPHIPMIKAK